MPLSLHIIFFAKKINNWQQGQKIWCCLWHHLCMFLWPICCCCRNERAFDAREHCTAAARSLQYTFIVHIIYRVQLGAVMFCVLQVIADAMMFVSSPFPSLTDALPFNLFMAILSFTFLLSPLIIIIPTSHHHPKCSSLGEQAKSSAYVIALCETRDWWHCMKSPMAIGPEASNYLKPHDLSNGRIVQSIVSAPPLLSWALLTSLW